jgi:hypothetical protein
VCGEVVGWSLEAEGSKTQAGTPTYLNNKFAHLSNRPETNPHGNLGGEGKRKKRNPSWHSTYQYLVPHQNHRPST